MIAFPCDRLANALLSANNTIDPAQARFISYTFSPADPGAPVFSRRGKSSAGSSEAQLCAHGFKFQNPYSQQAGLEGRAAT